MAVITIAEAGPTETDRQDLSGTAWEEIVLADKYRSVIVENASSGSDLDLYVGTATAMIDGKSYASSDPRVTLQPGERYAVRRRSQGGAASRVLVAGTSGEPVAVMVEELT